MGTRGAFGVIVGEQEKIGYNQLDSYPSGKGRETLHWLHMMQLGRMPGTQYDKVAKFRKLAEDCRVVTNDEKPTKEDVERLKGFTDLGVSNQSTDDWYCLTRDTHGDIDLMLRCGYIYDSHRFPLDSLFCEWAYIVDFDTETFEVYEGFQTEVPKKGRWAGRPTVEEDAESYKAHLAWCEKEGREPWEKEVSEYKAVELVGAWPFADLPDADALDHLERLSEEANV